MKRTMMTHNKIILEGPGTPPLAWSRVKPDDDEIKII